MLLFLNTWNPYRRDIWEYNMQLITNHNMEAASGLYSYTMEMNQYGDMVSLSVNTRIASKRTDTVMLLYSTTTTTTTTATNTITIIVVLLKRYLINNIS